ncbi:MAG: MBL fold metallo-hydrolase, partial [Chryseolinea sp.]
LLPGLLGQTISSEQELESQAIDEKNRLVLLGTQGGPFIRSYKQTPSANLIVYKGTHFVIDTGYGVTFKLRDAGVTLSTLKYIFITHHHSDHNLELGPLLYNAWIAGLKDPIHIYAPAGLIALLTSYWESNHLDIDTRIKDEGRPDIRNLAIGHEIVEGILFTTDDFEISCIKNIHPPINDSFAYKFKLGTKMIVFSGDTTYYPALEKFAAGADYLVHEVMYGPAVDDIIKRRPNATKLIASIKSHHTLAEDVGRVAKAANPKNLVLNHFVPPDDNSLTDQVWLDAVKKTFDGNVIVGKDLLQFEL